MFVTYITECNGTPYELARIAKHVLNGRHVCVKRNKWYEFNGVHWERHGGGTVPRHELSLSVRDLFIATVSSLRSRLCVSPCMMTVQKKCDRMMRISSNLQDMHYKDKCLVHMAKMMRDPDFVGKLDTRHDILAFKNGVWDMKKHRFRAGRKEDYLFATTGCMYYDDPDVGEYTRVEQYWEALYPQEDVRVYMVNEFIGDLHWHASENRYGIPVYRNIDTHVTHLNTGDDIDPTITMEFMRYVLKHYDEAHVTRKANMLRLKNDDSPSFSFWSSGFSTNVFMIVKPESEY